MKPPDPNGSSAGGLACAGEGAVGGGVAAAGSVEGAGFVEPPLAMPTSFRQGCSPSAKVFDARDDPNLGLAEHIENHLKHRARLIR